jgi:hypothetical protein
MFANAAFWLLFWIDIVYRATSYAGPRRIFPGFPDYVWFGWGLDPEGADFAPSIGLMRLLQQPTLALVERAFSLLLNRVYPPAYVYLGERVGGISYAGYQVLVTMVLSFGQWYVIARLTDWVAKRRNELPWRWMLPVSQLCLYALLVRASGVWPPISDPNISIEQYTTFPLSLAFAINLPAWVLSNIILVSTSPPPEFDNVTLVGGLLLVQWWMVGRSIERSSTRSLMPPKGGSLGYTFIAAVFGSLGLASGLLLVWIWFHVLFAFMEDPRAWRYVGIETALAATVWLTLIVRLSWRRVRMRAQQITRSMAAS